MKKKNKHFLPLIFLLCILCAVSFISGKYIMEVISAKNLSRNTPLEKNISKDSPAEKPPESTPATKSEKTEVTLTSVGDCTIGWDDKFSYEGSLSQVFNNNNKDYSYFFKNVVDIFNKDDITTANLETTFTNATVKADKQFTFKAPPDYAKALVKGSIEGVTIANNHTMDYLQKGFTDTKAALKAENINFFGEGEKWVTEVKGVKFGFLGYRGFSYDKNYLNSLKKDIEELKAEGCIVVINFHWGVENSNSPNDVQKYLAHYSIDNGADLIIGHHPHVIQGLEYYKNKSICYSLGNFCFGGNTNPLDKDTFIFQTNFKFENKVLKSYGIKVIPCTISSVNYKNDYCPTLADENKKASIYERLNKYSVNLNFKLDDNFYYIDVNN